MLTKSAGIVVRYGKYDFVVVAAFGEIVVINCDLHLYLLHFLVTQMLVMATLKQNILIYMHLLRFI